MEPLASLGSTQPTTSPPRVRDAVERNEAQVGAASESPPVEVSTQRVEDVDPSELRRQEVDDRPRVPLSGPEPASVMAPDVPSESANIEISTDPVQYRVVDRETREVFVEVPSDERIAFIESFSAYIGKNLDIYT